MDNYASDKASKTFITNMNLGGFVESRLEEYEANWVQKSFELNPEFWDIYENPQPYFDHGVLCHWHAEFVGKMLVGAIDAYKVSADEKTADVIKDIIANLKKYQKENGYIGPYPEDKAPVAADKWGHYFIIVGLCNWHTLTNDDEALSIAIKAANYLYSLELGWDGSFFSTERDPFNGSIVHGFALIYEKTQDIKFYEAAKSMIHKTWLAGSNWLNNALEGKEFADSTVNTRWENMHHLMALGEMYRITGDEQYYTAMDQIYWSLLKTDVHNNGGFSTNEIINGGAHLNGTIEYCCTVAWQAFSSDYLKLSKNPLVADELERTYLNSLLGSIVNGQRVAYNVDMSGNARVGQWSQTTPHGDIGKNAINLGCCTCNGARGVNGIAQWGLLTDSDAIYLNYLGNSAIEAKTPAGRNLTITQDTSYPLNGKINISLSLEESENFTLNIRIPSWAGEDTTLKLNGKAVEAKAGTYAAINREWKNGDSLELDIDMTVHYLVGKDDCVNLTSAYYGPILMTYNSTLYNGNISNTVFEVEEVNDVIVSEGTGNFWLFFDIKDKAGNTVRLADYATAGSSGSFNSLLKIEHNMLALNGGKDARQPWLNSQETGKELLETLISAAEAVDTSIYTSDSANALSNALANAKTVYADDNADDDTINRTATALTTALSGLVKDYSDRLTEKMPATADIKLENFKTEGSTITQSENGIVINNSTSNAWGLSNFPAASYKEKIGLNGLTLEYTVDSFSGSQSDPYIAIFITQNCGVSAWGITKNSGDGYMLIIPISQSNNALARLSFLKVGENYRPIYTAASTSPNSTVGNKITIHFEQHPTLGYQISINGEVMQSSQSNRPLDLTPMFDIFEDDKAYVSFSAILGDGSSPMQATLSSISVK